MKNWRGVGRGEAGLGERGAGEFRGIAAGPEGGVGELAEAFAELLQALVVAAVEPVDDPLEVGGVL